MKKKLHLLVLVMLLTALLAACGDNATPAPANQTTSAATTAPTAIPAAPTAALSSSTTAASATTVASVATTAASATTAATAATTVASAATTAASATTAATANLPKGGILRLATTQQDIATFHPYKSVNGFVRDLNGFYYSAGLVRRDPKTLEVIPHAAKSWTVDRDAKTVTFSLRDDIKWSDGTPITSADYVWTFEQVIKPDNKYPYLSQLVADPTKPTTAGILKYEAPDAKTIKVTLQTITFDIVTRAVGVQPLPKHVWEGKDWNDPTKNPEIDKPSVVSGPWLFKEWVRNERISFVRNDKSTLFPVPLMDGITWSVIPDSNVAYLKLKSGELDLLAPEAKDYSDMKAQASLQTFTYYEAATSWEYLGFNFRRSHLQDPALRQAMAYVTDRDGLIEKVMFGLARPMYANIASTSWAYNDTVEKYKFNVDKAKQILKDAGYTVKEGKLYDKSGQKLPELKFYHDAPNPEREKTAQILQQAYADLGLDVKLYAQPFDSVRKVLIEPPFDFDIFLRAWGSGFDPEQSGNQWRTASLNYGDYKNEEIVKLYNDVLNELDQTKRKDILLKTQTIEAKELPYIQLWYYASYFGASKRIGGINPTLAGEDYNRYADWYIKP